MIANFFRSLGWTRDDAKWGWTQLVAVAGLISSNLFDVKYWAAYLGIPLSTGALHWILAIAALVLWIAGRYDTSPLPGKNDPPAGRVKSPLSSVSRLGAVLLAVACAAAVSCAPKVRPVATVSVVSAHSILAAAQDLERANVCGHVGAAAAPACVPTDRHVAISQEFVKAFDADARLATLVRDWPQGAPPPHDVPALLTAIGDSIRRILAAIPPGTVKAAIVARIGGVQ